MCQAQEVTPGGWAGDNARLGANGTRSSVPVAEGHPRLILRTAQGLEPSCQDLTEGHGACNKTFASQTELPGARPCGAEPRQRPAAEGRANISAGRAGEPRARLTWPPGLTTLSRFCSLAKQKFAAGPAPSLENFECREQPWQSGEADVRGCVRTHGAAQTRPAAAAAAVPRHGVMQPPGDVSQGRALSQPSS